MPAMPPGCEIAAAPDAQGVTLSWPAYKGPEPGRYATGGFLLFWLSFWTLFGVTAIFQFVTGRGSPFLAFWLCGWAAGEAVVGWKLWDMFRPIRPEWVRLGTDRLEYDPGRGPSEQRSCADLPGGRVVAVAPAPPMAVPKAAVRGVGVDHLPNGRGRLYVELDDRRVEVGGCLTASERAWLLAVLRRWLGAAGPAPRWAPPRKSGASA